MNDWRWRARVETESGTVLGAGFLVDHDRVVTCAHVVEGRERVRVTFPGVGSGALPAAVIPCTSWAKPGDDGDIAVLRLDLPVDITPAAFASRDVLRRGPTIDLGAYGFPRLKETPGSVVELRTRPDMDLRQEWWQLNVPESHLESLEQGFSGAAVYLATTGEVVGMVTDRDRTADGASGRMLPLHSLRHHWEGLDDLLDLDWLTPEKRRMLRRVVRDAVPDATPDAVHREVFPGVLHVRRLHSVWDAIRYVAEENLEEDALGRFLTGLLRHLDGHAQERLAAWLRRHLPSAVQEPEPAPTSLIIRLDRMTRREVYELTLLTLVDGMTGPYTGPVEVHASEVRERVEEALAGVRNAVAGRDFLIEFALPVSLFNEPFETWYIEDGIRMRLYPVVLRDVQRMNPGSIRPHLALRRWRRLRERGTTAPQPVGCRLGYSDEEFQNWLDADEDRCVLAYAASPPKGRLNAALNAGVPVMLWPRAQCADPPHDDCPGDRRLHELTSAVAHVHPDDLPGVITKLRAHAWDPGADDDHLGRKLTLVWDDPARMPDPPLAMGA